MTVDKRELRRTLLSRRRAIPAGAHAAASAAMVAHLARFLRDGAFETVLWFLPHKNEPDLRALPALLPTLRCGLPVVREERGEMRFFRWKSGEALVSSRYGIDEPDRGTAAELTPDAKTAILVPAVALDRRGFRLGYGGGYYDRYLAAHPSAETIGVAFEALIVADLPEEAHDRPVRWLASEAGVLKSSP